MLLDNKPDRKNIVITGGNSGVGLETARQLFADGHYVIIGSRDIRRNNEAVEDIRKSRPNSKGQIKCYQLDLCQKSKVEDFVEYVNSQFTHIDVLVNNAGLIMEERRVSELGVEMTYAINHFGHFYLTYLLFPKIKKSRQARIINVSSTAHYQAKSSPVDDPKCENSWSSLGSYYKSKLANVMFTTALADRLTKFPNIKTASLHPGVVASQFGRSVCLINVFRILCCCIYVTNERGARTSLHLSRMDFNQLESGAYYDSDTSRVDMNTLGANRTQTQKLWAFSEELYDIKFDLDEKGSIQ